jgi:hypothetical protein
LEGGEGFLFGSGCRLGSGGGDGVGEQREGT